MMPATASLPPDLGDTWHIGPVAIAGRLILSPMAGYGDVPFRLLCRQMGSALSYVPCILDDVVIEALRRSKLLVDFSPRERPVAIQLLGKDEERLSAAARRVLAQTPDLIDLNLGCPAKRVAGRGRGAALLREPERIARIVARLAGELPVPLTAKIRLGWCASTRNHVEVARILEENGVAAIAVHGRTREQRYSGEADWEAIAEVRAAVRVPVLANGDVRTVADARAILRVTGCEAALVGRGALGNPWLFASRDRDHVSPEERFEMVARHLQASLTYHGPRAGLIVFRKHAVRYVQGLPGAPALRTALATAETPERLLALLRAHLEALP